ncbi:MAG: lysophospholipid acyltransferase family protein [Proteobacteria bacterium]|nr:lysophospholipid acyltransferase family protein [Pseudomonadota bacterium]
MSGETRVPEDERASGAQVRKFVALGSDPFEDAIETDPFLDGLSLLGLEPAPVPTASRFERPAAEAPVRPVPSAARPQSAPTPILRRHWSSTPPLAEVELPEPEGWLERTLGPEERRRLAALTHLVEGEGAYDRFGFAPEVIKRAFPFFFGLYKLWFRVESRDPQNLPAEGPAILVGNHGGLLPFDAAMCVIDVLMHTDPPRLARAIVDRWAGTLPWVNVFYARVGQVIGTRENFADLLADGQLLLVFPEGMDGMRKTVTQRYRLQRFRVGFIEQALRQSVPIVPIGIIGSDDQSPILHDFRPLARRLGLPVLPITPTFPWLGPLGLLPYPVRYRIVYGEPLNFHQRFGPEDAADSRLVQYLAKQVRRAVQLLVDRNR